MPSAFRRSPSRPSSSNACAGSPRRGWRASHRPPCRCPLRRRRRHRRRSSTSTRTPSEPAMATQPASPDNQSDGDEQAGGDEHVVERPGPKSPVRVVAHGRQYRRVPADAPPPRAYAGDRDQAIRAAACVGLLVAAGVLGAPSIAHAQEEPAPPPGRQPLVNVPVGCPIQPLPDVVFVGTVVDSDFRTVRFRVDQVRAGDIGQFASSGLVDVRYGIDAKYLDEGDQYLIGALYDPNIQSLRSRVQPEVADVRRRRDHRCHRERPRVPGARRPDAHDAHRRVLDRLGCAVTVLR